MSSLNLRTSPSQVGALPFSCLCAIIKDTTIGKTALNRGCVTLFQQGDDTADARKTILVKQRELKGK